MTDFRIITEAPAIAMDRVPVRSSGSGPDVSIAAGPFTLSDGASLMPPVPIEVQEGETAVIRFGALVEVAALNIEAEV